MACALLRVSILARSSRAKASERRMSSWQHSGSFSATLCTSWMETLKLDQGTHTHRVPASISIWHSSMRRWCAIMRRLLSWLKAYHSAWKADQRGKKGEPRRQDVLETEAEILLS
ncbi:hypothetical protein SERLA73DRAFT_169782 [Serpula lacrymans var. lacrymans S7.3]|uniref:Uncharacterized protein n=1 Tax=Serpula lacrymans var. lacrymans (strain S7.3) TaxID=936435 RepID=F8Q2P4_SERL3|nr:hypothetical protein SERLA73DRAFT_169782 [Serpula lacrymans var. lacrymans S7.3]